MAEYLRKILIRGELLTAAPVTPLAAPLNSIAVPEQDEMPNPIFDSSDPSSPSLPQMAMVPASQPNNRLNSCMSDSSTSSCTNCRKEFSLFFRKHHCRVCGGLFCFSCSNSRLYGLNRAKDGVASRICELCFNKLLADGFAAECDDKIQDANLRNRVGKIINYNGLSILLSPATRGNFLTDLVSEIRRILTTELDYWRE